MCCFSGPIHRVANTNIFARKSKKGHQFLVYSMTLDTPADVAMVLPIPVPKGSDEKAVRFINLEKYAEFFKDLHKGFPKPRSLGRGRPSKGLEAKNLAVVQVGSFEASFVPSVKDFDRLDKRFRLPEGTFDKLPGYKDWGFAVFKLKKGKKKIHPMAFEFPTRWSEKLFFPTVHIHDGKVHDRASFDHSLYLQAAPDGDKRLTGWTESPQIAKHFMKVERTAGVVSATEHCYWQRVFGKKKNTDITV